jgi:hypothetical protein
MNRAGWDMDSPAGQPDALVGRSNE